MATTTNYNWSTPDDTSLVKDGAAAIRTLGSSIDTTTKALNPSTTLGDIEYRSSTANTNTRLGIGTTGQVLTVSGGVPTWASASSTPSFVGASIYKSGNQSIANNTTTTITWDAEVFDTNAFHDNSTNNSRMTIPTGYAGKYAITGLVSWGSSATGYRLVEIFKNGATNGFMWSGAINSYYAVAVIKILDLAVGDYVEIKGFQNSGGNLNAAGTIGESYFQIQYLGA